MGKITTTIFITLLILCGVTTIPAHAKKTQESTFDRVVRTNTLRCGYIEFPPQFTKDANTGTFSVSRTKLQKQWQSA